MEHKIVSTIQKLLALSTSNNENEAVSALSKANALMKEYDISHADIEDSELSAAYGEMAKIENGEVTSQSKYKYLLFSAVSKLFKVTVMGKKVNPHKSRVSWIGRRHRVEIAIHTYEYLVDSIARITPIELKGDNKKMFQIGAATNICERIEQMLIENTSDNSNRHSIVLASHEREINEFLAKNSLVLETKAIGMKMGDRDGYNAANKINLNSHLNGKSPANPLALSAQK